MSIDAALNAKFAELTAELKAAFTERQTPASLVLTPKKAGVLLGVSEKTVRRWVTRGVLPRLPEADIVLIPRRAVEEFVERAA